MAAALPDTYKIGIAINPQRRLRELQTGSSTRLRVINDIEMDDAEKIERAVHALLDACRLHGEWFNAELAMITEAIEFAAMIGSHSPDELVEVLAGEAWAAEDEASVWSYLNRRHPREDWLEYPVVTRTIDSTAVLAPQAAARRAYRAKWMRNKRAEKP